MSEGEKYLLEMVCEGYENHEGDKWIGEEELQKIKDQAASSDIPESCSMCRLTVKNKDGNVLFIKEGC